MSTDPSQDKATEAGAKPATAVTLGRLGGAVGAVLLVTAPLTRWLTGEFGIGFWGKLLVGTLLVGLYLATNPDFFTRLARSRSAGLSVMLWASIVIVLGLLGVVNYLALENDHSADVTREGLYTLSPQTTALLSRLPSEVQILAFYNAGEEGYLQVEDSLKRYVGKHERVSFRMVDPLAENQLAERYAITSYQSPRIVVLAGAREARVQEASEQELTNAIIQVAEHTAKKVYFLTGHGSHDPADSEGASGYGQLAQAIRDEGYDVLPLSLLDAAAAAPGAKVQLPVARAEPAAVAPAGGKKGAGEAGEGIQGDGQAPLEVPVEAALLVIGGLQTRLFEPELQAIAAYLDRGGRLLVLLDPRVDSGLEPLLSRYAVEVRNDLVVDTGPMSRTLGPASPLVQPADGAHPATKDVVAQTLLFTARSLGIKSAAGEPTLQAQPLVSTAASAWGETDLEADIAELGPADHQGPLDLAVVATKRLPEHDATRLSEEARLVVFGDSDWVDNRSLVLAGRLGAGNSDLVLNVVNWMAEQEAKITIRPKARQASRLMLDDGQLATLGFFALDIIPVLLVALGVGLVHIRRQK